MTFDMTRPSRQNIAIVGGGIAGLASAWALSRDHRVTLFEAQRRLGGHARTVVAGRNRDKPVDTGFIVFNYATYPHLTAMFRDLDVPVQKSDMSFGVSLDGGRLEYALRTGNSLFGQRRNLLDPGFYAMIRDILRFNDRAEAASAAAPDLTIAELLQQLGLGRRFRDDYLFPLCGAIWSTPASGIGAFPAATLIAFLRNHALMSRAEHHQWWTVRGGSVEYVSRLTAELTRRGVDLRPGTAVRAVSRQDDGVTIWSESGEVDSFDQVVMACHADQALALLSDPSDQERANLGAVRFQANRAVLHADPGVMPRRRRCWSSWVYRSQPGGDADQPVGVSYWMNRLQSIPQDDPLFVTLNPQGELNATQDETEFRHPVFDAAAIRAQGRIARMQGQRRSWFAGAWLRHGFHEDGFASAMRIARQLIPERV